MANHSAATSGCVRHILQDSTSVSLRPAHRRQIFPAKRFLPPFEPVNPAPFAEIASTSRGRRGLSNSDPTIPNTTTSTPLQLHPSPDTTMLSPAAPVPSHPAATTRAHA